MIRQFFRQAWTMMKQQRLFTGMYLMGTAVSIALAMTLFIIFYIKLGPIYPEYNRHRMLVIDKASVQEKFESGGYSVTKSKISRSFAKLLRNEVKSIDRLALQARSKYGVSTKENGKNIEMYVSNVNNDFWQVFNYRFVEGLPFDDKEERVVVISTALARQLFADTKVIGRKIYFDTAPYNVVGVVEKASGCTPETEGDLWKPIMWRSDDNNFVGNYKAYITSDNIEQTTAEIEDVFNRFTQGKEKSYTYSMEVEKYWQDALDCGKDVTLFDALGKYLYVLLAFLFIPALNLSGMISSRMDGRLEEIGVRKAYGAARSEIIAQVLWENLLLTLMGSLLGLALSYIVIITSSNWITAFFETRIHDLSPREINADMLMNPMVLFCILTLTLLLNVASALVPTLIALRKNIVESLYHRR